MEKNFKSFLVINLNKADCFERSACIRSYVPQPYHAMHDDKKSCGFHTTSMFYRLSLCPKGLNCSVFGKNNDHFSLTRSIFCSETFTG